MALAYLKKVQTKSFLFKVFFAYLAISSISLLSTLLSLSGYYVIHQKFTIISDNALPGISSSFKLSQSNSNYVDQLAKLIEASDEGEHEKIKNKIHQLALDMKAHLAQVTERASSTRTQETADRLAQLNEVTQKHLEKLTEFSLKRIQLRKESQRTIDRTLKNIELVDDLLAPHVIRMTDLLFKKLDNVNSLLEKKSYAKAQKSHSQVINKDIFAFENLNELRFRITHLNLILKRLQTNSTRSDILQVREDFALEFRSLVRLLSKEQFSQKNQEISNLINKIAEDTLGRRNLFQAYLKHEDITTKITALAEESRTTTNELNQAVDKILAQNSQLTKNSSQEMDNSLRQSLWVLLLLLFLSATLPTALLYFFLYKNLYRRLHYLIETTRGLSEGKTQKKVQMLGNDELGEISKALEVFRNNALRIQRNEALLNEQKVELERSNKELQQFAYVASHDLRSPLRGIDSLASWLEEDLKEMAGPESKKHLQLMRSRVQRMEMLLEDLLEYSRVDRIDRKLVNVPIEDFLNDLLALLQPTPKSPKFHIKYNSSIKEIKTVRPALEIVLRNLISNAITHHDKEEGTITISLHQRDSYYEFSVADDGPGIHKEFQEKVFQIFQTLRSKDEVNTSGVGLALVKKLLTSLHCEIQLQSNPEQQRGSTFTFEWPIEWGATKNEPNQ